MSGKSHHRKRPSVDRVFELLADLDDAQMEALLQEANSTISSNIAVSQAIDFLSVLSRLIPHLHCRRRPRRLATLACRANSSLHSPREDRRSFAGNRATASPRRRNQGPAPSP
ncbi:hypothetical protein PG988_015250 [Apiospora saccharicola]